MVEWRYVYTDFDLGAGWKRCVNFTPRSPHIPRKTRVPIGWDPKPLTPGLDAVTKRGISASDADRTRSSGL
jgi:hypothetical protein